MRRWLQPLSSLGGSRRRQCQPNGAGGSAIGISEWRCVLLICCCCCCSSRTWLSPSPIPPDSGPLSCRPKTAPFFPARAGGVFSLSAVACGVSTQPTGSDLSAEETAKARCGGRRRRSRSGGEAAHRSGVDPPSLCRGRLRRGRRCRRRTLAREARAPRPTAPAAPAATAAPGFWPDPRGAATLPAPPALGVPALPGGAAAPAATVAVAPHGGVLRRGSPGRPLWLCKEMITPVRVEG